MVPAARTLNKERCVIIFTHTTRGANTNNQPPLEISKAVLLLEISLVLKLPQKPIKNEVISYLYQGIDTPINPKERRFLPT